MDRETLNWIKENRPNFSSKTILNRHLLNSIKEDVIRFTPLRTWYLEKETIDSIHGLRHTMRVIANLSFIIQEAKIHDGLKTKAFISASIHDLRRKNDKNDRGHGKRAAYWFAKNAGSVLNFFNVSLDTTDLQDIQKCVLFHEIPYGELERNNSYIAANDSCKMMVDLLKTADALDRYRLPKIKWWINEKYLRHLPSETAKILAYEMVLISERLFLERKNSVDSVLQAIDKIRNRRKFYIWTKKIA